MTRENCEQFLECVLDISSQMVECGAEARRVENTALRMVNAYGFQLQCANAINSEVDVSIKAPDGSHYTQSVRVLTTGTDLGKLERLNAMARQICQETPPVEEIVRMVAAERKEQFPTWMELIGFLLIPFSFAIFFGGDVMDGLTSALMALLIFGTNQLLNHRIQANQNKLFYTFLACSLSGCLAIVSVRLGFGHHSDKIMIGDVMLFIPGLSIVNGVRELFYRDIITGLYRLVEAIILAVAIAAGFAAAILLMGGVVA